MKSITTVSLLIFLLLSNLSANKLEDSAFKEYKNKNYTISFVLYTKAASKKSIKSLLMLGLFFEKGLGVKKDSTKAIKFYKLVLKKSSNIKEMLKDEKRSKIAITALKRLTKLTGSKKYRYLVNKFSKLKQKAKQEEDPLFGDGSTLVDDFFILCPFAALVAPEDREGIESFDCALFENFPKKMVLFMRLRRLRLEALSRNSKNLLPQIKKLDTKIAITIKPMINYLQQEAVKCYQNSEESGDIKACDYDYLLKSDPLLFDHAAYKMEQADKKNHFKSHKLDIFEKNDLINELISNISQHKYGKPWRNMVK